MPLSTPAIQCKIILTEARLRKAVINAIIEVNHCHIGAMHETVNAVIIYCTEMTLKSQWSHVTTMKVIIVDAEMNVITKHYYS